MDQELDSLVSKLQEKNKKEFTWDEVADILGAEAINSEKTSEALMLALEK